MIRAAMPKLQLERSAAHGEAENLMAQTDAEHRHPEVPELDSVAVERFAAEWTTSGAPADQISRARISGGGISHAFDRPAS
jgi:hypothetical protein